MTDDEWAYFEPFLIHRGGGRPPRNHRRVLDVHYISVGPKKSKKLGLCP
jgi:hypothetical protein